MDLRRLRAFVTVAEHGTVSKAAQVLHISQPALSRQIAAFEQRDWVSAVSAERRQLGDARGPCSPTARAAAS